MENNTLRQRMKKVFLDKCCLRVLFMLARTCVEVGSRLVYGQKHGQRRHHPQNASCGQTQQVFKNIGHPSAQTYWVSLSWWPWSWWLAPPSQRESRNNLQTSRCRLPLYGHGGRSVAVLQALHTFDHPPTLRVAARDLLQVGPHASSRGVPVAGLL